jgi:hypothetical protein
MHAMGVSSYISHPLAGVYARGAIFSISPGYGLPSSFTEFNVLKIHTFLQYNVS